MNIFKNKKDKEVFNAKDLYLARIKNNTTEEVEYILAKEIYDEKQDKVFLMDIKSRLNYTYNDNSAFETVDSYFQLSLKDNYLSLDEIYKISQSLVGDKKIRTRK